MVLTFDFYTIYNNNINNINNNTSVKFGDNFINYIALCLKPNNFEPKMSSPLTFATVNLCIKFELSMTFDQFLSYKQAGDRRQTLSNV